MISQELERNVAHIRWLVHSRWIVVLAIIMGVVLAMMTEQDVFAQENNAGNVTITVEAPAQVKVGEVITLRLRVNGDAQVGAFEALLLYPPTAAEFSSLLPALPQDGLGVGQLVVPQMSVGSAVGFYTCATASCLRNRAAQERTAAEPGLLAEVELLPLVAGQLQVNIAHLQVVDSSGRPLTVAVTTPSLTIQVGEGGQPLSVPADVWSATGSGASVASITAADVTHDGAVSHSDLMEVALAWQSERESSQPCSGVEAGTDINGDGCVDIVDVQGAAAYAGDRGVVAGEAAAVTTQQSPESVYLPQLEGEGAADSATETTTGGTNQVNMLASALTITVNSTLDEFDINDRDGVCKTTSKVCTLRAAIEEANAITGSNLIVFAIPGDGVHTIQLESRLPAIHDETGGTTVDGYSQPGSSPNTDPLVDNAKIMIEIRGGGFAAFDGMPVTSAHNVIRGLSFYNLKRSLWIYGTGAFENMVVGDFIGTNAAGTFTASSVSEDQAHGVHVEQGSAGNHIGGVTPAERNVISGNARHGIGFWHGTTDQNLVVNNIIGLSPDGLRRLPNGQQGVDINYGAAFNIVGGTQPGERNVISANTENGAEVTHGEETTQNMIVGNYIGTDVTGESTSPLFGNGGLGVSLHDRITNNLVKQNVIGNNRKGGLLIDNFGNCCARENRVENNWIGITPSGKAIGNSLFGIRVTAMQSHIGPGNVIAYNLVGVRLEGDDNDGNTITQNSIFSNTGLGIDIDPIGSINANDEGDADAGANEQLNYPVILNAMPVTAMGSACSGCTVEIFTADQRNLQYGEGKTFVGTGTALDNGAFTVTLQNVKFGDFLTATATDLNGNTSEFSRNALVTNPDNAAPTAVDDNAVTNVALPVTIDVLANDVDVEGDALMVVAVDTPGHGEVNTDGALVIYTPTVTLRGWIPLPTQRQTKSGAAALLP
jgi:CSLREA domain-containing protein